MHLLRGRRLFDELDALLVGEEARELGPELDFGRVGEAVGEDELVDRLQEPLLALLVEALEDLETTELQLVADEGR
jgi:hypothetical protein